MQSSDRQKLKKLWVWVPGQLARGFLADSPRADFRVEDVRDGSPVVVYRYGVMVTGGVPMPIQGPLPVLSDAATADGLPRTARAAWNDPTLTAFCGMGGRNWTINTSAVEGVFETESDAWLAAILAAPEGT